MPVPFTAREYHDPSSMLSAKSSPGEMTISAPSSLGHIYRLGPRGSGHVRNFGAVTTRPPSPRNALDTSHAHARRRPITLALKKPAERGSPHGRPARKQIRTSRSKR